MWLPLTSALVSPLVESMFSVAPDLNETKNRLNGCQNFSIQSFSLTNGVKKYLIEKKSVTRSRQTPRPHVCIRLTEPQLSQEILARDLKYFVVPYFPDTGSRPSSPDPRGSGSRVPGVRVSRDDNATPGSSSRCAGPGDTARTRRAAPRGEHSQEK